MSKPKLKMVEVYSNTHLKVKAQAAMRGMTIRDYVDYLANLDKKIIMKEQ